MKVNGSHDDVFEGYMMKIYAVDERDVGHQRGSKMSDISDAFLFYNNVIHNRA